MWDSFREEVEVELQLLNQLLETQHSLITKSLQVHPNLTEITALGSILHSFYTGIESIFKRVAKEIDRIPPTGDAWHRDLLRAMAQPNAQRPALISKGMEDQLLEYLRFRHFFRNAYSFELQWKKMSPLVAGCEKILRQLETELSTFLKMSENKHGK